MIIGITGTDGAGKGAVVDYLVEHKGFAHYSNSGQITKEIERRGMEVNRANQRLVGNDMRREFGRDVLVVRSLKEFTVSGKHDGVFEAIRALAEAKTIKANGGVLLVVDADQKLRYERITKRGSAKDSVSFEKFCEQEAIEMNDPDPHGMQKAKVMEMADYTIMNEGTLEELHEKIEDVLKHIV